MNRERGAEAGSTPESTVDPATESVTDALPDFDEGRYLYCVVPADEDEALEKPGVDDEPVSVVTADGVGAVVHACDGIYDSADPTEIRRWLVRHQAVVDAAGERFGTPIPFQFDTILKGDDEGVRGWLHEERDTLERALEGLAGHWEYRVEVRETDPIDGEDLLERDDRLADLRERIDAAEEGTAFLLEKQFDRRVRELRKMRRETLSDDLVGRLAEHAREVHELERSPSASLSTLDSGESGSRSESESAAAEAGPGGADDGAGTLCRLTLLAHEDREGDVGSVLDEVASEPGLEVRFTGPWPPYTFAPTLGGDDEPTRERNRSGPPA
ncbi:gas vesicle protein GvpL [Natrialbaceae archaeon GCM10025810]|uniref:gas vesicle protein GvpL n=1 Tax=Halovalidus salilacus TaxID=3075124 RepID=UPI003617DAE8